MTYEQALARLKEVQQKAHDQGGDIHVGHGDNGVPTQSSHYEQVMSGMEFDQVIEALEKSAKK